MNHHHPFRVGFTLSYFRKCMNQLCISLSLPLCLVYIYSFIELLPTDYHKAEEKSALKQISLTVVRLRWLLPAPLGPASNSADVTFSFISVSYVLLVLILTIAALIWIHYKLIF